jgi:hypothetical protein
MKEMDVSELSERILEKKAMWSGTYCKQKEKSAISVQELMMKTKPKY